MYKLNKITVIEQKISIDKILRRSKNFLMALKVEYFQLKKQTQEKYTH